MSRSAKCGSCKPVRRHSTPASMPIISELGRTRRRKARKISPALIVPFLRWPNTSKRMIDAIVISGMCMAISSDRTSKPLCPKTPSMKGMPRSTRFE